MQQCTVVLHFSLELFVPCALCSASCFFCSCSASSSSIIWIHSTAVACCAPAVLIIPALLGSCSVAFFFPTCSGWSCFPTFKAHKARFSSLFSICNFPPTHERPCLCRSKRLFGAQSTAEVLGCLMHQMKSGVQLDHMLQL